jgi:hypothetical protein
MTMATSPQKKCPIDGSPLNRIVNDEMGGHSEFWECSVCSNSWDIDDTTLEDFELTPDIQDPSPSVRLRTRVQSLEEVIDTVLRYHTFIDSNATSKRCAECHHTWPCYTYEKLQEVRG